MSRREDRLLRPCVLSARPGYGTAAVAAASLM
jgi:hypothetical protein